VAAAACYACDEPAHSLENAHSAATYANSQDPYSGDRDNAKVDYFFFFQMPRTCAIWSNNQLGWFSEVLRESSKGCAIWTNNQLGWFSEVLREGSDGGSF
jgi:hypothetical protein